MRKPELAERFYLDFDGFFASVEQQASPALRDRPVGVIPFAGADQRGILIACSREAKMAGVGNVMNVQEAKILCPDIVFVPQSPDLYRRAHNALVSEITAVVPLDAIKSIDEMTGTLGPDDRLDPMPLARRIKSRIRQHIGPYITSSIGFAANRQLAKIACKASKRSYPGIYGNGALHWPPSVMPAPLLQIALADIPGIGSRMAKRLDCAGIRDIASLLATQPKQMRALWRGVTGERLWYALHGYDVQAQPSARGMYGHGRVLPPEDRSAAGALATARLLAVKAARRMRREGYYAGLISLMLSMREARWGDVLTLPAVRDDHAILSALSTLWERAPLGRRPYIVQVGVTLGDLTSASERQLDILTDDDRDRQRWETATDAIDRLNRRYGRTVVSLGLWRPPSGGNVGGKISYTRIPRAEDFT
jgi:DNA polymerase-4